MARIRTVRPHLFQSTSLNQCSVLSTLTFVGLLTLADDEGRFVLSPGRILGRLYAWRDDVSEADVEKCLAELAAVGCISAYIVDGVTYGYLPGWKKYQRIAHPTRSPLPAPPREAATAGNGDVV